MHPRHITEEKIGRVLRVTLNRPDKLNAINLAMEDQLLEALERGDRSRDISVIVIRGAGRAFSAGHDLTEGGSSPDFETEHTPSPQEDLAKVRHGAGRFSRIAHLSVPVVAQLHGYCMGIGTCLALNCDFLIAAEGTKLGFPPVRWGGSPATHMWTYLVGPQWAKYMLLSGDTIDCQTATKIGLYFRTSEPDRLDSEVLDFANHLSRTPKDLLATNKGICNKALDLMGRKVLQDLAQESDVFGHFSPDAREFLHLARTKGMKAALEWQEKTFGATS
jgi:enoyl-CoA hydratase